MSSTLIIIYLATILIVALTGVVKFASLTTPVKFITILAIATFISESLSTYIAYIHKNNEPVFHFYVILSFWIYALIYFHMLNQIRLRLIFLIISLAFTVFCALDSLFYQKLASFPSINIILSNAILVCFSLFYFKHLIDVNPFEPLKRNSSFWFNIAVLAYFSIQIFIWGILNYLIRNQNKKDMSILLSFAVYVSICYYIALGLAILLDIKTTKADIERKTKP